MTDPPSMVAAQAWVARVERPSPTFVRVTLSGPDLLDFGDPGLDTRIKLVFPGPTGRLPEIPAQPDDYYDTWLQMSDGERAPMRTYTTAAVRRTGSATEVDVELVVHAGANGPACRWARAATPGDVVHVVGPHRCDEEGYGGTEFDPGGLGRVLLVADETALPAVTRIVTELPDHHEGDVFVEIASAADIRDLSLPPRLSVHWVVRGGAPHGRRVVDTVRSHLGLSAVRPEEPPAPSAGPDEEDIWETPGFSAAGEDLGRATSAKSPGDLTGLYAWIAGESEMARALRRALVSQLGLPRKQVAFMGYWREAVSMKS